MSRNARLISRALAPLANRGLVQCAARRDVLKYFFARALRASCSYPLTRDLLNLVRSALGTCFPYLVRERQSSPVHFPRKCTGEMHRRRLTSAFPDFMKQLVWGFGVWGLGGGVWGLWWVVGGVVALGSGSSQSSVVCFSSGPSLQRSNQKFFSCGALGCLGGRWSGDGCVSGCVCLGGCVGGWEGGWKESNAKQSKTKSSKAKESKAKQSQAKGSKDEHLRMCSNASVVHDR